MAPDQLASEEAEASLSRSTQFPIKSIRKIMYFSVSHWANYFQLACLENCVDPDQLASKEAEASQSRSTLFQIKSIYEFINCFHQDNLYEPVHEISNNLVCATSKASDQPAHTRSLIRAFASNLSVL